MKDNGPPSNVSVTNLTWARPFFSALSHSLDFFLLHFPTPGGGQSDTKLLEKHLSMAETIEKSKILGMVCCGYVLQQAGSRGMRG